MTMPPSRFKVLASAIALSSLLSLAPTKNSQAQPTSAREHRQRGVRLYDVQKYLDAVAAFETAYQLSGEPDLLFAIGQAYRLAGEYQKAITSYEAYLRSNPEANHREAASRQIERCRAALLGLPTHQPAQATASAQAISTNVASPQEPAPMRSWYRDPWAVSMLSVGALSFVGGAILFKVGHDDIRLAREAPDYQRFQTRAEAAERGVTLERLGTASLALGSGLLATGLLRILYRDGKDDDSTALTTIASESGLILGWSGRFH